MLTRTLETIEKDPSMGVSEGVPFLCILDFLEIISDLVLAIPACAAAIHRFNSQSCKSPRASKVIQSMQHAMHGSSPPTRNFVSYILHCLLPQNVNFVTMKARSYLLIKVVDIFISQICIKYRFKDDAPQRFV